MKKNKLWLLLKIQMRTTLGRQKRPEAKKREDGPMKMGKLGKAPPARSYSGGSASYTVMMAVVGVIMVALVTAFSWMIAEGLRMMDSLHLLPAIMMFAGSVMALVTTIYKTNGMLFGFKDYDAVMSLPIKTSTVITSRLLILYALNFAFTALLMVPSSIIYAMFAAPSAGFWPVFVICLLLVPLVPVIIATLIGSLIAWVSSHFKRKNGVNIIFTVAVLLLWMLFCFNMQNVVEGFIASGNQIMGMINRIYPLVDWYTQAVCDLNMGAFALFALVSVGAFAVFVAVVAKNFTRINASLTANRTTSDYKMGELKQSSPKNALFKKELRRFSSSSTYVMNTGIGLIMLTILCIIALAMGVRNAINMIGYGEIIGDTLTAVAPIAMSFFLVMTCPSASSVSLEGKSLWIVKTLPVSARDVLMSKLRVNLMLIVVGVLVNSTLLAIALQPDVLSLVFLYITPLLYGVFTAELGLVLNLRYPNFDWDNEVKVVKQSAPVMGVTLLGMAITIVPAILALFFGMTVVYIVAAALAVVSLLLYRSIVTRGVATFEAFQA